METFLVARMVFFFMSKTIFDNRFKQIVNLKIELWGIKKIYRLKNFKKLNISILREDIS